MSDRMVPPGPPKPELVRRLDVARKQIAAVAAAFECDPPTLTLVYLEPAYMVVVTAEPFDIADGVPEQCTTLSLDRPLFKPEPTVWALACEIARYRLRGDNAPGETALWYRIQQLRELQRPADVSNGYGPDATIQRPWSDQ